VTGFSLFTHRFATVKSGAGAVASAVGQELGGTPNMSQNRAETTWRHETAQRVETFAARHKFIYLILISLLTFIGYAYLFLFPAGVVLGIEYVIGAIPKAATMNDWEKIGAMISVALLCGVTCLHILRFRQSTVSGLRLEREQTPELFKLVDAVCQHYGHRKIRKVILTGDFQLEIRHTPVAGFPLWFTHTLLIGLPLLQTVAPKHFRCELARRIGQHSRRGHRITHRVFLARRLWNTYLEVLNTQPRFGDQLLRWFFRAYAPLFDVLTLPAARWDELAADSSALDFINDNDVFETMKITIIGKLFLAAHYWPKIRKMAVNDGGTGLSPFAKLESLTCTALRNIDGHKWLGNIADSGLDPENPMPDFRRRMRNIGHEKIRELPRITATAARLYLKDAYAFVVPAIDKLWQTTMLPAWKMEHETRREDIETIRALSEMSQHGRLSFKEIWCYARLANALKGRSHHRSILKLIRRNFAHGKTPRANSDTETLQRLNDVF
jgi:hypothetical protein